MTYIIQTYKSYDVSGGSIADEESGMFFPTLCITKHRDSEGVSFEKIFDLPRVESNLFHSADDAIQAALSHGYRIIDEEVFGQTVNNL